ncbi:MAG TPA: hypothetical protein PK812_10495 [Beijerinckiaceae bacterium]|nr:hypothetical protein [Beijerinckiaceae bacterium]
MALSLPSLGGIAGSIGARIPFIKRNRTGSHMRAHQRIQCCLMGEVSVVERGFKIEGLVIEVSRGGMRFREASHFVMNRTGVDVTILVSGGEYPGRIMNSSTTGYGIKLDSLITEEEMERLIASGAPKGFDATGEAET